MLLLNLTQNIQHEFNIEHVHNYHGQPQQSLQGGIQIAGIPIVL